MRTQPVTVILTTFLLVVGLSIAPFAALGPAASTVTAQSDFTVDSEDTAVVNANGSIEGGQKDALDPTTYPGDLIDDSYEGGEGAVKVNGETPGQELTITAQADQSQELVRFLVEGEVATINSVTTQDGQSVPTANNNTAVETISTSGQIIDLTVDGADYTVTITDAPTEVTEGDDVGVAYEVENTGPNQIGTPQDISFAVTNDTGETVFTDTEAGVDLASGETFSSSFSYTSAVGDAPELNATVASATDTDSATVTVQEEAFVDVTINETLTDDATARNDSVTVAADLQNTGGATATQNIVLDFGATDTAASQSVTLNGSETETVELTADVPADATLGDTTATVRSDDANATATVDVRENAPFFDVSLTTVPTAVTEGEDVTVDYEVNNTGDVTETQTIAFSVDGADTNTTELTVANESTETGSFTYTTTGDDIPSIDVGVASEDTTDTATVTVNEDAFFDVTITNAPANVTEGDDITVDYDVTNTGGVSDTQDITFAVDGTTQETAAGVQLDAGNATAGSFTYTTSDADLPSVTAEVASDDDTATETIAIDEIGVLDVTIDTAASDLEVTDQENVTVVADVENTGDVALEQDITANVTGTTQDSEANLSVAGGDTTEVTFEFGADVAFDGQDVTVASNDTTDTATLTVLEVGELTVDIDETASDLDVNDQENVTVVANLTNTGDTELTQDVTASVNGTTQATDADVTVAGKTTDTATLTFPADAAFDGQDVRVDTDDSNDTAALAVAEVGQLDVQNLDAPDGVNQSEEITVSADLTNTGETPLTQNISLLVDGETVNTTDDVTVAAGSQQPVSFTYTVDADRQSNLTVAIESEDAASNTKDVALIGLGDLTVEIDENASSLNVTDEENVSVAVNLTNTGEIDLTQTLTASVAGTDQTSQPVAVNGTNSTTTTLEFPAELDFDGQSVTVASQDDTDTALLEVAEVGELDVTINESASNLSVTNEENVTVVADVENTGDVTLEQDITANVTGTTQDSEANLAVTGGDTTEVTFEFAADLAFDGEDVTVASADTTDTAPLTVLEVGELTVENFSAPTEVPQGERLTVGADIVNTGDVALEQDVTFLVDGEVFFVADNTSVGGNSQASLTFDYPVPADRTDDVNVSLATADDQSQTATVDVLEVGELNVSINETASDLDVTDDENVTVVTEVTNTGEAELTQNLTASVNGTTKATESDVAVAGGETETVTFAFPAELGFDGQTVSVASNDTTDTASLTVVEAPFFEVTELNPSDTQVVENESFTVTATINNTGAVSDTQPVELQLEPDGPAVASQTVSLNGSETTAVEFPDVQVAPGTYNHTVATADDSATGSLTVISETANFELSGLDPADATVPEGADPIDVGATVTNTGNQSGTQTVTLTVRDAADEGVYNDTVDVALDRQTGQDVTFPGVPVGELEPGEYTHEVATANETVTGSLTVAAAPVFEVAIENVTSPVTAGDDVTVEYTIENTGTVNGTQPINFSVGETVVATNNTTLAGGATTSGTFTYTTESDDAPSVNVSIASADTTATETVTVNQPATASLTNLSIGGQGTAATITEGDTVPVTALLENTGDLEGDFTATLEIGTETITATQNETVAGGDSQRVGFTDVTGDLAPGTYNVTVSVGNETLTGTLTVDEQVTTSGGGGGGGSIDDPAVFEVTGLTPGDQTVAQGATFDTSVTIENTGERPAQKAVELRVDNDTIASQLIVLGGGQQQTIELTDLSTAGLEAGDYEYGVFTDDGNQTATLTIDAPADTDGDDGGTDGDDGGTDGDDGGTDGDNGGTDGDDGGTNGTDGDDGTDDPTPGFGIIVALLALVLAAGFLTRRE